MKACVWAIQEGDIVLCGVPGMDAVDAECEGEGCSSYTSEDTLNSAKK